MKYTPAPMFLEFMGKSDSFVFSRNTGSKYIKAFVPPSNPDTTKQVQSRAIFAQVAPLWPGLSVAVRSNFDSFANSDYIPLNRKPDNSGFTGRQAFSALAIAATYGKDFIAKFTGPVTKMNATGAFSTVHTVIPYAVPTASPGLYFSSNLLKLGSWSSAVSDFTYTIDSAVQQRLTFTCVTPLPAATYTSQVLSFGGTNFGLALYVSNQVSADGIKTQNDFESKLLQTQVISPVTIVVASPSTEVGLTLTVTSPNLPVTTGWRKATLVACSAFGGQKVILQKYINFG